MVAEERAAAVVWRAIRMVLERSLIPADAHTITSYYLLVTGCNINGETAGRVVGCTRQNISKCIRKVEELRESARFDDELAAIEQRLFGD